jgi:hypothetical protein
MNESIKTNQSINQIKLHVCSEVALYNEAFASAGVASAESNSGEGETGAV